MDRYTSRITKRSLVLALGLLALLGVSIATSIAGAAGEGKTVKAGQRNPAAGDLTRETEIIANNSTYGTRQSNKSTNGGGVIYGCRAKAGGTPGGSRPCVRANNLVDGLAFEFASSAGAVLGTITSGKGGDTVKPFTTNATGVATGLNADQVDGKSADDLLAKDGKAADADKLDGKDSAEFASAGDLLFAAVTATGTATGRGVTGGSLSTPANNTFTVTFSKDVSKCSFTATETGAAATAVDFAVQPVAADGKSVTVDETDGATAVPFHLQVIC